MPTYSVTGINVGTFNLGESDRLLTIFTAEKGLMKAVAKGARKPGAKMTGRSEVLNVNQLLLATGRSLDIITQAETKESFPRLRKDLIRLAFGLYYAELTQAFGQGLNEESEQYFQYLCDSLRLLADSGIHPGWLCLQFEMGLLDMLGYKPELTRCVMCREPLSDYDLGVFHQEWGGIICRKCYDAGRAQAVREPAAEELEGAGYGVRLSVQITPLVWKQLVLAASSEPGEDPLGDEISTAVLRSIDAARRLIQHYIEHRAGKRMKSLEFVKQVT